MCIVCGIAAAILTMATLSRSAHEPLTTYSVCRLKRAQDSSFLCHEQPGQEYGVSREVAGIHRFAATLGVPSSQGGIHGKKFSLNRSASSSVIISPACAGIPAKSFGSLAVDETEVG